MFLCLLFAILTIFSSTAVAIELAGPAGIIDGDTISVGEHTIRLHGIDVAEVGQGCSGANGKQWPCDKVAMDRLQILTAGGVRCVGDEMDDYDRLLAVCYSAEGKEINRSLVREGLAWAFIRYSEDYA